MGSVHATADTGMTMGEDSSYDIEELASLAGMTARNVRAYRTRGLLPAPRRRGRSARYGEEHLDRLREVARLREAGIPLRLITELAQQGSDLGPESRLGRLALERLRDRALDLRDPVPEVDLTVALGDGLADGAGEDAWSPLGPVLAGHLEQDEALAGRLEELGVLRGRGRTASCRAVVTVALSRCAEHGIAPATALGLALEAAEHADRLAGRVGDICGEAGHALSVEVRETVVRLAAGVAVDRLTVSLEASAPA